MYNTIMVDTLCHQNHYQNHEKSKKNTANSNIKTPCRSEHAPCFKSHKISGCPFNLDHSSTNTLHVGK